MRSFSNAARKSAIDRGVERRRSGWAAGSACCGPVLVIGAFVFGGLVFAADQGIGLVSSQRLEQKRLAGLELQHAAFAGCPWIW